MGWIEPDIVSHREGGEKKDDENWWRSIDEEDSGAGQGGQGVGHLADSGVVDESSKEEQEAWRVKGRECELQLEVLQGTLELQLQRTCDPEIGPGL